MPSPTFSAMVLGHDKTKYAHDHYSFSILRPLESEKENPVKLSMGMQEGILTTDFISLIRKKSRDFTEHE